jgi:MFS family permease
VIGGILLEATGKLRPTVTAAVFSTGVYGLSTLLFAVSTTYPLSVLLLVIGGVANLASMSIGQTLVQLLAPPADRGRVIGVYGMSTNGLRFGSGITVGLFGAVVGIHWSLGLSAAALCVGTVLAGISARRA